MIDDTEIVFCKDCEYILKPTAAGYEPHPESLCSSINTNKTDYVIGEIKCRLCKEVNIDGHCIWFKRKEQ